MIIAIQKSELFTVDPDIRFCRKYKVPQGTWRELWKRYKLLQYTNDELSEYFLIKTKRNISNQNIKRWLLRTEIYLRIEPIAKMGCEIVLSEYFGDLEWVVIEEITKNIKSSVKGNPKVLL